MIAWKKQERDEGLWVTLIGQVTEHTDLTKLAAEIDRDRVILDLAGIRRVNSSGVREWLKMVRELERRNVQVIFDRCSVAIVHQLNMIEGFEGHGIIRSIYAPYYCASCNSDEQHLVQVTEEEIAGLTGEKTCSQCRGPMEFDDLPEPYLTLARFAPKAASAFGGPAS